MVLLLVVFASLIYLWIVATCIVVLVHFYIDAKTRWLYPFTKRDGVLISISLSHDSGVLAD